MFKKLLKNNIKWVVIAGFFTILASLALVYAGYSLSFLMNATSYKGDALSKLFSDALLVTAIWLVALVIYYFSGVTQANLFRKLRNELRDNISRKIANIDYEEFYKKDSGNYVSWLTNDVEQISEQAFSGFFSVVENLGTAIFSLVAMMLLNFYIGLIAIVLFAILTFAPQLLGKLMAGVSKDRSEGQERFVESSKEIIMGHNVFRLYNLFQELTKRINKSSNDIEDVLYKYAKMDKFVSLSVLGFNLIGQVAILVGTIVFVIKGMAPIGAVLAVGNLAGSFFSGVGSVIGGITNVKASKPVFEKFEGLVAETKDMIDIADVQNIEVTDLSFSYGDKKILNNFNGNFKKGEKYALIGESGSGKSTLAKILLGFLKNYEGNILIDKTELTKIKPTSLYKNISYIDQSVYLFNGSIRDNICLGEKFSDSEVLEALAKSSLLDFVENSKLGLDTLIEENGKNLSGGQRQRLALARAFIRKINFLIIDEGTSALDEKNALEIEDKLMDSKDIGVVIITHHLRDSLREKLDGVYNI